VAVGILESLCTLAVDDQTYTNWRIAAFMGPSGVTFYQYQYPYEKTDMGNFVVDF
jgi:hypothetical protein